MDALTAQESVIISHLSRNLLDALQTEERLSRQTLRVQSLFEVISQYFLKYPLLPPFIIAFMSQIKKIKVLVWYTAVIR